MRLLQQQGHRQRLARGFLVAAALFGLPRAVAAQITTADDPCHVALSEWGNLSILTQVSYTDADRVADAFTAVRRWITTTTGVLRMSKAMLGQGGSLTAEERAARQQLRDCLPWLRNIIRRLDDAMKESNINVVDALGDRNAPRGGIPRADAVAVANKAVAEALAEAKAQLDRK